MTDNKLSTRVTRIVSGSASAFLSAIEDAMPEAIMEQAISEIDLVTEEARQELGRAKAASHMASTRSTTAQKEHDSLKEQIGVAVSADREDLATAAIEKQIGIESSIDELNITVTEAKQDIAKFEGYIAALQDKKAQMNAELTGFIKAKRQNSVSIETSTSTKKSLAGKVDSATSVFDRVLGRQTGMPALGGVGENSEQLAELEAMTMSSKVKARLEAAKNAG